MVDIIAWITFPDDNLMIIHDHIIAILSQMALRVPSVQSRQREPHSARIGREELWMLGSAETTAPAAPDASIDITSHVSQHC